MIPGVAKGRVAHLRYEAVNTGNNRIGIQVTGTIQGDTEAALTTPSGKIQVDQDVWGAPKKQENRYFASRVATKQPCPELVTRKEIKYGTIGAYFYSF